MLSTINIIDSVILLPEIGLEIQVNMRRSEYEEVDGSNYVSIFAKWDRNLTRIDI